MRKFATDFETTTDVNDCRVWAYSICEIGDPDNFMYGNSLDDFMSWCENQPYNPVCYFHNAKFDTSFIEDWLLKHGYTWIEDKKDREDMTFTTLMTDMSVFYSMEIFFKVKGKRTKKVTIYDSLKILNFSVAKIAKDFDLPIRKLELDYKAYRAPGHVLTPHEIDYIRNDVEIMARALDIMFKRGLTKMTIGSDALADFKDHCKDFKELFPVLPIPVDSDIRKSYKGGFTYLNPIWQGKITGSGIVLDVNSLYPSRLKLCTLPYGTPESFEGKYVEDAYYPLFTQTLTCAFKLKPGKIPSIQLRNSASFMPNEYVESSKGELVTLSLCNPDLELFFEQYDVWDITYQGGWKFKGQQGIFDEYIDYWTNEKIQAKKDHNSSMYRIAKLMLNSCYGKFASSTIDLKKYPYLDSNNKVSYHLTELKEKKPIYTAVASFTTAYARRYTIETSQYVRDWSLKHKGYDAYIYSDTDSIHAQLTEDDVYNGLADYIEVDKFKLGAWDLESQFKRGKFLRQKCYIEEDDTGIHATVAGMPKALSKLITFDNFKRGFTTADFSAEEIGNDAKLLYKRCDGGIVLVETDFTIK